MLLLIEQSRCQVLFWRSPSTVYVPSPFDSLARVKATDRVELTMDTLVANLVRR